MKQGLATLSGIMHELKKPKYHGNFSCEMPGCGRNQERNNDQNPSSVLTWTS